MGQLFSLCCTERLKVINCDKCKKSIEISTCLCDLCRIMEPYEYESPHLISL